MDNEKINGATLSIAFVDDTHGLSGEKAPKVRIECDNILVELGVYYTVQSVFFKLSARATVYQDGEITSSISRETQALSISTPNIDAVTDYVIRELTGLIYAIMLAVKDSTDNDSCVSNLRAKDIVEFMLRDGSPFKSGAETRESGLGD